MIKIFENLYYSLIFIADSTYKNSSKIYAIFKAIVTFAPIAFLLNQINFWFANNREFIAGFLICVVLNARYGIKKHRVSGDFKWETFFKKTREMLGVVISIYVLLSILAEFSGENVVAEAFQIGIQVMTLMFPIAKAIRSIHIIYNGEYTPKWLMEKIYGYEKTGNMENLLKTKKDVEQINNSE